MALNADGSLLATAGWDGTARIWHVAGAREIARLSDRNGIGRGGVRSIVFSPDDRYVALGNSTNLYVMNVQQVIERFPSKK